MRDDWRFRRGDGRQHAEGNRRARGRRRGDGDIPIRAAGGVLLGVTQNLSLWQLSGRWQDVVVFGLLLAFLALRPQGIFGHMLVTRHV